MIPKYMCFILGMFVGGMILLLALELIGAI